MIVVLRIVYYLSAVEHQQRGRISALNETSVQVQPMLVISSEFSSKNLRPLPLTVVFKEISLVDKSDSI